MKHRVIATSVMVLWLGVSALLVRASVKDEDDITDPESRSHNLYKQARANRHETVRQTLAPYYRIGEVLAGRRVLVSPALTNNGAFVRQAWKLEKISRMKVVASPEVSEVDADTGKGLMGKATFTLTDGPYSYYIEKAPPDALLVFTQIKDQEQFFLLSEASYRQRSGNSGANLMQK